MTDDAICPNCGSLIQGQPGKDRAVCLFCRAEVDLRNAVVVAPPPGASADESDSSGAAGPTATAKSAASRSAQSVPAARPQSAAPSAPAAAARPPLVDMPAPEPTEPIPLKERIVEGLLQAGRAAGALLAAMFFFQSKESMESIGSQEPMKYVGAAAFAAVAYASHVGIRTLKNRRKAGRGRKTGAA